MRSRSGRCRSQSTNDVSEGTEALVDVDRLLESILVLTRTGGGESLRTGEVDKVENSLIDGSMNVSATPQRGRGGESEGSPRSSPR